MHYKINLKERFENRKTKLAKEGYKTINEWTEIVLKNEYSLEDENFIINSKLTAINNKEITIALNRSYLVLIDKIRRLKISENRL
ncbi:hypothetical protein OSC52_09515 [Clostridium pasteurianum]|uniref:hypothetical protein n=1 Tax=Clostridium pasteurianum TaxID=1501 RepID=UPI002260F4F7|nr:hypothetical protein [Clostridium pasteurianum]UZW16031.1 hypothetical protein OSC52_09515 [Clostridium pasteurianum]